MIKAGHFTELISVICGIRKATIPYDMEELSAAETDVCGLAVVEFHQPAEIAAYEAPMSDLLDHPSDCSYQV